MIRKTGKEIKRTKVMDEQWDYLIILDACRYDYFERLYAKYLAGNLSKKLSVGSSTDQWRDRSFTEYHPDVIYISSNPYMNSLAPVKGFSANEHFCKIYDLWRENWDDEKGTVLPESVTKRAIDIIRNNPDKRAIIHYMQPHEPYLGAEVAALAWHRPDPVADRILKKADAYQSNTPFSDKIIRILADILYRIGLKGHLSLWKVRKFLNMPPMSHMDAVRRKYGKEGVRKAYEENLNIALKHVARLVNSLSGKIVITADHGEMLGEKGCYCHWNRASNKFLIEIPWLAIDKGKKVGQEPNQKELSKQRPTKPSKQKVDKETQKQIQEKLRALGYYD